MRKAYFLFLILIFTFSLLFAGTIFEQYSAVPATNQVTIKWRTLSESDVASFNILRGMDIDNITSRVTRVTAAGPGSDYTFIDENVMFKSSQTFYYKIQAIRSDETVIEESSALYVNPNISGIYRTWGAIKAIFR